jgi:hypothetical protein
MNIYNFYIVYFIKYKFSIGDSKYDLYNIIYSKIYLLCRWVLIHAIYNETFGILK